MTRIHKNGLGQLVDVTLNFEEEDTIDEPIDQQENQIAAQREAKRWIGGAIEWRDSWLEKIPSGMLVSEHLFSLFYYHGFLFLVVFYYY